MDINCHQIDILINIIIIITHIISPIYQEPSNHLPLFFTIWPNIISPTYTPQLAENNRLHVTQQAKTTFPFVHPLGSTNNSKKTKTSPSPPK